MSATSQPSSSSSASNPALQPDHLADGSNVHADNALSMVQSLNDGVDVGENLDGGDLTIAQPVATAPKPEMRKSKDIRFGFSSIFSPRLARWRRMLAQINDLEPTLMKEDDTLIRKRSLALRYRAMAGEKLGSILPEAYALAREAAGVHFRCVTMTYR